jgi:hypothetical protein
MSLSPKRASAKYQNGDDVNMQEAFSLLNIAIKHEDDGDVAKAYDNYMHAVTLFQQWVQRLEAEQRQQQENALQQKSPARRKKLQLFPSRNNKKSNTLTQEEQPVSVEQQQWEFENEGVVPLLRQKIYHYSRYADELIQQTSNSTSSASYRGKVVASAPMISDLDEESSPSNSFVGDPGLIPLNASITSICGLSEEEGEDVIVTGFAAQSNAALTKALALDEQQSIKGAVEHYIEAGEWLFKAIDHLRQSGDENGRRTSMKQNLTKRLEDVMARAEQLKQTDGQTNVSNTQHAKAAQRFTGATVRSADRTKRFSQNISHISPSPLASSSRSQRLSPARN